MSIDSLSVELRFGPKRLVCTVLGSMLTGIWVFSMEILYISYVEFFKVTCTAVQELYRSSLVYPLILIRRATFCSKRLVRTVPGKYVNCNLSFFQWRSCLLAMGEFFKVTCTAVQELHRSSLVCPMIPIRRAAFWSERLVCTVLGSMLTGIWVFSMEILCISYVNFSRSPVRPYKNCTGQVWYVHWFSSRELSFDTNG